MATSAKQRVIAIEEHYYDPALAALFKGLDARAGARLRDKLENVGELRLKEMDEAGIDVQVLSHGAPSTQKLDPETAVRLAREVNDRLHLRPPHDVVAANPAVCESASATRKVPEHS